MKQSRKFGAIAVLGITSLLLTGCMGSSNPGPSTGGSPSETSEQGKGSVRIASAETADGAMSVLQEAAKEYSAQTGVDVTVEAVPLTDIYTKVNAAKGTSAEYDAFLTGFVGHISLFHEENLLAPVDDIIEELGGAADFYDGDILFPIDDEVFWVPFDYNLAFGAIRTDWLAEAGLEIPTTWDEFLAVAKAFDARDEESKGLILPLRADDASNWITSQVLWANNVEILDDNFEVIIDEGENRTKAIESFDFLKELHQYMPERANNGTYADQMEAYISGQVGITFYSGRVMDNLFTQAPDLVENTALFAWPNTDEGKPTVGYGGDGWAIFDTDSVSETKAFTTWFFQNKMVDIYASAPFHYMPAQRSIYESDAYQGLPTVASHGDKFAAPQQFWVENAIRGSIDTSGPDIDVRTGDLFQSMYFAEAYQRVTVGNQSSEEVLDWLAAKSREVVGK